MNRSALLLLLISTTGCFTAGELRHHHTLSPPPATGTPETSAYRVRVDRVSGVNSLGGRHRVIPGLWVELRIENRRSQLWELRATDLRMLPGDKHAAGFAEVPNLLPKTPVKAAVTIGPGKVARVWARFDNVRTQQEVAARLGVDAPALLAVQVRTPSGEEILKLSDPGRGTPIWTPTEWPYFGTVSFGTGGTVGKDPLLDATQRAMTLDISTSANRRFGELDVGLVGQMRMGIEAHPVEDGGYAYYGVGLTAGYTLQLGSVLYVRPLLGAAVGWTGSSRFETTSAWLHGELQFGIPRRSTYPYRERSTNNTVGWYLRGETRLTSFSEVENPYSFGLSLGLVLRGGS